jgi:hypothetical protein
MGVTNLTWLDSWLWLMLPFFGIAGINWLSPQQLIWGCNDSSTNLRGHGVVGTRQQRERRSRCCWLSGSIAFRDRVRLWNKCSLTWNRKSQQFQEKQYMWKCRRAARIILFPMRFRKYSINLSATGQGTCSQKPTFVTLVQSVFWEYPMSEIRFLVIVDNIWVLSSHLYLLIYYGRAIFFSYFFCIEIGLRVLLRCCFWSWSRYTA